MDEGVTCGVWEAVLLRVCHYFCVQNLLPGSLYLRTQAYVCPRLMLQLP